VARVFKAISICVIVGGCTNPLSQSASYGVVDPSRQTEAAREVAPSAAVASLPVSAGRVVQVREKRFWNGLYQEVTFAPDPDNRGENGIDFAVETERSRGDRKLAVPIARPTEASIRSEIEARFPGASMQIVNQRHLNPYGEFGLAIGRMSDGARCIYAWQWIDDVHLNGTVTLRTGDEADPNLVSPASLRVRLCRLNTSVDDLVALVQKVRLDLPNSGGTGQGTLDAMVSTSDDKRLAVASPRVQPQIVAEASERSKPKVKPKANKPAPHKTAVGVAAPPPPPAGALLVPAPSYGTNNGAYGARYLAPVDNRSSTYSAPQTTGSINGAGASSLPAQAFGGPAAAQKRVPASVSSNTYGYNYQVNQ
jgi:Cellulose biosynthesis protein BcsN